MDGFGARVLGHNTPVCVPVHVRVCARADVKVTQLVCLPNVITKRLNEPRLNKHSVLSAEC